MGWDSSRSLVSDAPSLCQVLSSGPTLHLPSVALEDAGDYVCRAEPRRSGLGGGTAQARLTVNGERPQGSRSRGWAEGAWLRKEVIGCGTEVWSWNC